jgi:hypothetical protein
LPELTTAKSVFAAGAPQGRLNVGSLRSPWVWLSGQWIRRGLWAAIISLVVLMGVMAAVPPVSRDALTHHLAVPKLYLQHGGMVEIPAIEFSYYPMNLDLLYLLPLYFGNDILPKFIHFAFALATTGLIFGYLRRRTTINLALAGALFFLSLPVIVKLSITVYVDLGLIFFTTWSLLSLLRWRETGFRVPELAIAAVACGLALGTKYNALPAFLLLTFLVPVLYVRNQPQNAAASRKAVLWGACFASIALAVFFPWMIRNLIWTGNPIFPLYDGLFNPGGSGNGSSLGPWAIRKLVYGESWWETLLIPLRIFFQGQDDLPQLFDGRLNPLLLILPIFAFFPRMNRGKLSNKPEGQGGGPSPAPAANGSGFSDGGSSTLKSEKLALLGFSVGYLLIAFFTTDMRVRYISPIIPPLVILAVLGFQNLFEVAGGERGGQALTPWRALLTLGVLVFFSLNGGYIFQLFSKVNPVPYISGQVTREAYITQHRPEYPAIAFVNRTLPQDARILSIFLGNRRYYFDREVLSDLPLVQTALADAANPEDLLRSLKNRGVTHLVVGSALFNNWVAGNLSPSQKVLLQGFFNEKTRALFMENGHAVLELL